VNKIVRIGIFLTACLPIGNPSGRGKVNKIVAAGPGKVKKIVATVQI
jgi:hypothetical protein